jgi:hypothetical protein
MRDTDRDFKLPVEIDKVICFGNPYVMEVIIERYCQMALRTSLLSSLVVSAATISSAVATPLVGTEIKELIGGKTIFLSTGYGFSLPLRYEENGEVTGDGRGTMLGKFFAPKETGKWWVQDNRLCQRWSSWYEGRTFCFVVKKTGSTTIEWRRDDGFSGTARISG